MIKITTTALPNGVVGDDYHALLEAVADPVIPVLWSCSPALPLGLTLDAKSGAITGVCEEGFFATILISASSQDGSEKASKPLLLYIEDDNEMLVGTVIAYSGAVADDAAKQAIEKEGWLLCDGSPVSRADYNLLFDVVGIAYGTGDGIDTFNLPDYRGQFLRGVSGESNVDPDSGSRTPQQNSSGGNGTASGNTVGAFQKDELRSHAHSYTVFPGSRGGIASGTYWEGGDSTTGSTGGSETRPTNVYVNFLVRFRR